MHACRPRETEDRVGEGEVVDAQKPPAFPDGRSLVSVTWLETVLFCVCSWPLCRRMGSPVTSALTGINRVLRDLKKHCWEWTFYSLGNADILFVFTDSQWVGDKDTRKSTSGACIMVGTRLISHWSKVPSNAAVRDDLKRWSVGSSSE